MKIVDITERWRYAGRVNRIRAALAFVVLGLSSAHGQSSVAGGPASTVTSFAVDPSPCQSGMIWYNTTSSLYKTCPGGVATVIGAGSGSGTVSANSGSANALALYAAAGGSTTVSPDAAASDDGTTFTYIGTGGIKAPNGGFASGSATLPNFSGIAFPCIAAPGTPSAGTLNAWCDSTDLTLEVKNSAGTIFKALTINATNNTIPKRSDAKTFANSLLDDGGTTANTLTYTGSAGVAVPNGGISAGAAQCTAFGTAGGICAAEGTPPTNVSGAAPLYPDGTLHEYMAATNGSSTGTPGMMVRSQPGTGTTPGVHFTAQTATKTIYTLCAASAGACNQAGEYRVTWYFNQGGTACGTPGTGGVTFALSWTDNAGAHSAIALPMNDNGSIAVFGTKFTFQTANASAFASGEFNLWSTGASAIQVTNTYSACGVGTGTWELAANVERLQ